MSDMTKVQEAAWELAQRIYWTVEHPNPGEALIALDEWKALREASEQQDKE